MSGMTVSFTGMMRLLHMIAAGKVPLGNEPHTAFRTISRLILTDLRMHRTYIDGRNFW